MKPHRFEGVMPRTSFFFYFPVCLWIELSPKGWEKHVESAEDENSKRSESLL